MKQWWVNLMWIAAFVVQIPLLLNYLLHLSRNSSYSWLVPGIALGGFGLLLSRRWDFQLRPPRGWFACVSVSLGALSLLIGALNSFPWLASIGFLFTVVAFCDSQLDRTGRRLTGLWAPLLSLIIPVGAGFIELNHWLAWLITLISTNSLRFLQVPHLAYSQAVDLTNQWVFVPHRLAGGLSLPIFLAAGMLHSAVFRRHFLVVFFNVFNAGIACVIFHAGLIVWEGLLAERGLEVASWHPTFLVLWGILAYGVFASCERGFCCLLTPIPDDVEESAQTNPLVFYWDLLFAEKAMPVEEMERGLNKFGLIRNWALPFAVVLSFIGNVVPFFTGHPLATKTNWNPPENLVQQRWGDQERIDHSKDVVWESSADIWSIHTPRRVAQWAVIQNRDSWTAIPSHFQLQGWKAVSPPDDLLVEEIGGNRVEMRMYKREEEHMVIFEGRLLDAADVSQNSEEPVEVRLLMTLIQAPDSGQIRALSNEFSALLEAVQSDLSIREG